MGIYLPEMPCKFCGKPLGSDKDQLIGFAAWVSSNPLILELNDTVVHRRCLSQWEKRDDFIKAYNQAMKRNKYGQLKIDRNGQVRYKKCFPLRAFAAGLIIRLYIYIRGFSDRILGLFKGTKTCDPATACPFCNKPLRSSRAKQCPHCSADWHDPKNVKGLPVP
jgi:hypothetical protein